MTSTTKDGDATLLRALRNIQGAGCYHTEGERPFSFPGIRLKSGEELAFPLPPSQALAIKAEAEAAPYGLGAETVHDETVRKCWQIDVGELEWVEPEWEKLIGKITREVAGELGVEGAVVAEPYKLLLYEEGGFFLPHRDTEKIPAMFGSLIVSLPSFHCGGQLVIRHDEREATVDFSKGDWRDHIRFAAFFADCEHEVLPVTKGFRLCLVYNLAIRRGRKSIPNPAPSGQASLLLPGLARIGKTRGDDLSAILLDHRYTEANFRLGNLKGDDLARARALFEAAKEAGMAVRLALVSLYQMGELMEDYEDYRYYRRGRRESDGEGEMGEIYDESLSVDHWRSRSDRRENLGCFSIGESQLISGEPLGKGEPDEEFAEGFTGNAGCTMEHWYRRAAIVIWPKSAEAGILARYNFPAACLRFEKEASKKGAADQGRFLELGRAVIKEAKSRFEGVTKYEIPQLGTNFLPILRGVAKARCETLFSLCQGSLLSCVLTVADASIWKLLLDAFGAEAVDAFFQGTNRETLESRRDSLISALSAALGGRSAREEIASPIAARLTELLSGSNREERYFPGRWDNQLSERRRFHVAIAASYLLSSQADRKSLREHLWSTGGLSHLRDVLGPALLEKTHCNRFASPGSIVTRLLADSIRVLESETGLPLLPYPDWSRPVSESTVDPRQNCDNPLLVELAVFLKDADSGEYRFKRSQHYRTMLEEHILRHRLDLDLRTDKKGTPHTLVCRKNDQSFHRAVKQRAADEKLLRQLRALMKKLG